MFYLKQFSLNYNCRWVNFSLAQNKLLKELLKRFFIIVYRERLFSTLKSKGKELQVFAIATNSDFLIPIYLQPKVVDLKYFKS